MELKLNMGETVTAYLEIQHKKEYSFRPQAFYLWLDKRSFDVEFVAKRMNISSAELIYRLRYKMKFTKEQITRFVYLAKADAAFWILYFESFSERKEVYKILYEKEMPIRYQRYFTNTKREKVVRNNA